MDIPARSLEGIRIAVTRPQPQAEDLARVLRAAGAVVVVAPLIRIVAPRDAEPLRAAVRAIATFDWIVFSSVNGIERFVAALEQGGSTSAVMKGIPVACVGPVTAAMARRHGLDVAAMPDEFVGDAIADALTARGDLRGKRILLARAGGARSALPQRLHAEGAIVSDVEVYRSEGDPDGAALLERHIANDELDAITLTSASAVKYFVEAVETAGHTIVAVIGPVTAAAARSHGLDVAVEAEPHTTEALVAGLIDYFRQDGPLGGMNDTE